MHRTALTRRIAVFSVLLLAFVGTVTTLNVSLYSATGFVSSYLNALARHDVDAALQMRGVSVTGTSSRALLAPTALAELSSVHLLGDVDAGAGIHNVTYGYRIGGVQGSSTFAVQHTGSRFGVFSAWRFNRSPISVIQVTPLNSTDFTANGIDLVSAGGSGQPVSLAVLTPARITLSHKSLYFSAITSNTLVQRSGAVVPATVNVQANDLFVAEVQKELNANLDSCVTQRVLLPTGCPMGTPIADRLQDAPTWSMVKYPLISIEPGASVGQWIVPATTGVAHLNVKVKAIFDGTLSTFDKDVPFTVRYEISFPAGVLTIVAQY